MCHFISSNFFLVYNSNLRQTDFLSFSHDYFVGKIYINIFSLYFYTSFEFPIYQNGILYHYRSPWNVDKMYLANMCRRIAECWKGHTRRYVYFFINTVIMFPWLPKGTVSDLWRSSYSVYKGIHDEKQLQKNTLESFANDLAAYERQQNTVNRICN